MDNNKRSGWIYTTFIFGFAILIAFCVFIFTTFTSSTKQNHDRSSPSKSIESQTPLNHSNKPSKYTDIFKAKKITYLTDLEKDYFAAGYKLPELSPDDTQSLARRLSNESSQLADNKDFDTARKYRTIVHSIRKRDVEEFPEDYLKKLSLAVSLAAFGNLETQAGNYDEARSYLVESIDFLKTNETTGFHKSLWLRMMMWRHRDLGDLELKLKQYDSAKIHYNKYLEFVVKNPSHQDYFYDHAEGYFLRAELSFKQELWTEAAEDYSRSIILLKKRLSDGNPRDELLMWQRLAYTYQQYAYTAYLQYDNKTALTLHLEAINARKNAIKSERSGTSEELDLATTYYHAARQTRGKDNEFYLSALEILERLKKTQDLPKSYEKMIEDIDLFISR